MYRKAAGWKSFVTVAASSSSIKEATHWLTFCAFGAFLLGSLLEGLNVGLWRRAFNYADV